MSIDLFQPLTNPVSKETFKAISFDENAYITEWTVQAEGYVPLEHIHLNQDEIFHIHKGELRVVIDGKEIIGCEGETVTVPKGAKHIAYNNRHDTLHCVVEYRPGLDHDKFMQCFMGLIADGYIDKQGAVHIPKMGYCLRKMNCKAMARPTSIPAPAFGIGLFFFYVRGTLSGWNTLFKKYTGLDQ